MYRRRTSTGWTDVNQLRRWTGTQWNRSNLKRWTGTQWVDTIVYEVWVIDVNGQLLYTVSQVTGGGSVTQDSGGYVNFDSSSSETVWRIDTPFDLTNYNTITIRMQSENDVDGYGSSGFGVLNVNTTGFPHRTEQIDGNFYIGTYTIDISDLSGSYYLGFVGSGNSNVDIYEVKIH